MYRTLFLVVSFYLGNCDILSHAICRGELASYCRPTSPRQYKPPHNYYHGSRSITPPAGRAEAPASPAVTPPPANSFEGLAQNLVAAERAIQKLCQDSADIQQVFESDSYIIKYKMPGFVPADVAVKIKHRVMHVTANKPGLEGGFEDIRMLPSTLQMEKAQWMLENDLLTIFIPCLASTRGGSMASCGAASDAVIAVQRIGTGFELRFGAVKSIQDNAPTIKTQPGGSDIGREVTNSGFGGTPTTDTTAENMDKLLVDIFGSTYQENVV